MRYTLGMQRGFTLIELLIVLAVTSIISAAALVAYPHARAEQKLKLAEQSLQAALRGAQQSAINEERDDACVAMVPPGFEAHCSDTGIIWDSAKGSIIVFSDINNATANQYEPGDDFKINELSFPEGVQVEPMGPFIFEGTPPTITLWLGTREVTEAVPVTLRIGNASRELNVGSYGQVERK